MNILSDTLKPPPSSLTYLPQLDAVRAFAVLLVLWHHWCPPAHGSPGAIGVWTFFVISGFLITRILLKSRADATLDNQRKLYNFYVRRFLRIFPLYYFLLLLAFFASAAFRANWYWYVAYLQNFKIIFAEPGSYIFGTHLWSLAVEEQFYIVWPLVILFAPRVLLLPIILSAIVAAVATRFICAHLGWSPFQVYVFTPSSLDTLGSGALLAYFVTYRPQNVVLLRWIAFGAAIAIVAGAAIFKLPFGYSGFVSLPTGLLALWLVSKTAEGIPGLIGRVLSFPPIIYIGRISYGIYVYHYFVPMVLQPLFDRFGIKDGGFLFVVICFIVTMAVSSLSWFLLENPINSLKNRFAGSSRTRKIEAQVSPAAE